MDSFVFNLTVYDDRVGGGSIDGSICLSESKSHNRQSKSAGRVSPDYGFEQLTHQRPLILISLLFFEGKHLLRI